MEVMGTAPHFGLPLGHVAQEEMDAVWRTPFFYARGQHGELRVYATPDEGQATCVFVHPGFTEPIEKYFRLIKTLEPEARVVVFDPIGQAGSPRLGQDPEKILLGDFDQHIGMLHELLSHFGHEKNMVIGHSMGGHVALRARLEGLIDAPLFLSNPMVNFSTKPWPSMFVRVLMAKFVALGLGNNYAPGRGGWDYRAYLSGLDKLAEGGPLRNIQLDLERRYPVLRTGGATCCWIEAAFRSCDRLRHLLRQNISMKGCVWLISDHDEVIDNKRIAPLVKDIKSLQIHHFDAGHELLLERDEVAQSFQDLALAWLRSA